MRQPVPKRKPSVEVYTPIAEAVQDTDTQARWRVCLHEAGHAVAGQRLLKRTARAVVHDSQVGAAYIDRDNVVPRTASR